MHQKTQIAVRLAAEREPHSGVPALAWQLFAMGDHMSGELVTPYKSQAALWYHAKS